MGPAERVALVVTVGLVLTGLVFRLRGYLFGAHGFWLDEADWAIFLTQGRRGDDSLRPIGFMAVSRLLVAIVSPSERVLRALPWVAGVATTLVSPFLARRLFDGRAARLMFVAILALHPSAIDLAKEFKPYSVSLALHTLLLYTTLRYASSLRGRALAHVLVVATFSQFFAQDMVFAYPGVFLLLGWEAYQRRSAHLPWVIGSATAIVLGLAAQYYFIWRQIPSSESTYWGNKYNVFHLPLSRQAYLSWFLERYRDLCELPGYRHLFWQNAGLSEGQLERFRRIDTALWVVAHALGLVVLVLRRKYRVLLLALTPLVALGAFNYLKFWPLGAFRTNLFALLYMAVVAAAAFDGLGALRARSVSILPAAILVVVPLVMFEDDWHAHKRAFAQDGYFPEIANDLVWSVRDDPGAPNDTLFLSRRLCPEYEYYTTVHPRAPRYRKALDPLFVTSCLRDPELLGALKLALRTQKRVWVVLEYKSVDAILPEVEKRSIVTSHTVGNVWIAKIESKRANRGVKEGDDSSGG